MNVSDSPEKVCKVTKFFGRLKIVTVAYYTSSTNVCTNTTKIFDKMLQRFVLCVCFDVYVFLFTPRAKKGKRNF